jgi:hypothetical protein
MVKYPLLLADSSAHVSPRETLIRSNANMSLPSLRAPDQSAKDERPVNSHGFKSSVPSAGTDRIRFGGLINDLSAPTSGAPQRM